MSQVMNKKALIDVVASKLDMTKKDAAVVVETVFDTITESLVNENKVDISGFGKFEVKTRKGRSGINPATKETIEIPASKACGFKAAKALKEAIK
ncbi:MAG: HU family DNA-binding protein [Traorella sp.]